MVFRGIIILYDFHSKTLMYLFSRSFSVDPFFSIARRGTRTRHWNVNSKWKCLNYQSTYIVPRRASEAKKGSNSWSILYLCVTLRPCTYKLGESESRSLVVPPPKATTFIVSDRQRNTGEGLHEIVKDSPYPMGIPVRYSLAKSREKERGMKNEWKRESRDSRRVMKSLLYYSMKFHACRACVVIPLGKTFRIRLASPVYVYGHHGKSRGTFLV